MNAVEFTKWMAEQDITGADEKAVYYMALLDALLKHRTKGKRKNFTIV